MQLKPQLDEVLAQVRTDVSAQDSDLSASQIERIVDRAVARGRITRARNLGGPHPEPNSVKAVELAAAAQSIAPSDIRVADILNAIKVLAEQPPAEDVLWGLSDAEVDLLDQLPSATRWLEKLLAVWSARRPLRATQPEAEQSDSFDSRNGATRGLESERWKSFAVSPTPALGRSVRNSGQFDAGGMGVLV